MVLVSGGSADASPSPTAVRPDSSSITWMRTSAAGVVSTWVEAITKGSINGIESGRM